MWLDLHSVQRDKGFERVQGTMHVPGAWPQDWGAPCLFHVLSKGKGSGVLAVLLLVLPGIVCRRILNSVIAVLDRERNGCKNAFV